MKRIAVVVLVVFCAVGIYVVALRFHPSTMFAYSRTEQYVTLYADEPLVDEATGLIERVTAKIERSPLFDRHAHYDAHLCQHGWRFALLTGGDRMSSGVSFGPFGRGAVLRQADVRHNRIRQASGRFAPGERTLDVYIAHELTHTMTADHLGLASLKVPAWVREGYADYVGRGADFDYADARAAMLGFPRIRAIPQTGRYLRYTLAVARLLERDGWTVDRLLRTPPVRTDVEDRIRRE